MLARGFGMLIGYVLACLAFSVVIVAFVFTPAEIAGLPSDAAANRLATAGEHVLLSATQVVMIAAPLALIAALIAEWRAIRGWLYFAAVGLSIAVLGFLAQYWSELQGQPTIVNTYAVAAFLCGGVVAGTVYWLVVGRTAGRSRPPLTDTSASAPASTPDPEKA
jgi:hypothetical protein